jgi:hypothetical protein
VGRMAYFAGQNSKTECIALKICTVKFSGFLITSLISDLSDSKWRMYFEKKLSYCRERIYCKLFEVTD